jgi:hypothetical protein
MPLWHYAFSLAIRTPTTQLYCRQICSCNGDDLLLSIVDLCSAQLLLMVCVAAPQAETQVLGTAQSALDEASSLRWHETAFQLPADALLQLHHHTHVGGRLDLPSLAKPLRCRELMNVHGCSWSCAQHTHSTW